MFKNVPSVHHFEIDFNYGKLVVFICFVNNTLHNTLHYKEK